MIRMMTEADEPMLAQLFSREGARPSIGLIPPCSGSRILPSRPGARRSGWRRKGAARADSSPSGGPRASCIISTWWRTGTGRAWGGPCLPPAWPDTLPGLPQGGHAQHHGDGFLSSPGLGEHRRDGSLRHHGALAQAGADARCRRGISRWQTAATAPHIDLQPLQGIKKPLRGKWLFNTSGGGQTFPRSTDDHRAATASLTRAASSSHLPSSMSLAGTIQVPPQAITAFSPRYSFRLAGVTPPVGMKRTG